MPRSPALPYPSPVADPTTGRADPGALSDPAIRCRGLVKRYPDVVAVDGLDLTVRRGECFGLLGPNGAGKTTTVEILEGLTPADEGRVELLGTAWGEGRDRWLRERLGIQLQETQLPDKLQVHEVIRLFRSFTRRGRSLDQVLAQVSLEAKRGARVEKLSGGQKQRLALACALVGDPEILFLDEPTTGLDPQARRQLWELVERFRAGGGTVLLTTHYMEEAARLCDRVAVMDHGKILASGSPEELVASLGAGQVVEMTLDRAAPKSLIERWSQLPAVEGVHRRPSPVEPVVPADGETEGGPGEEMRGGAGENGEPGGDTWRLTARSLGEALPAILAALEAEGLKPARLATHEATLEDVFVALTGRELRDG